MEFNLILILSIKLFSQLTDGLITQAEIVLVTLKLGLLSGSPGFGGDGGCNTNFVLLEDIEVVEVLVDLRLIVFSPLPLNLV